MSGSNQYLQDKDLIYIFWDNKELNYYENVNQIYWFTTISVQKSGFFQKLFD